LNFNTKYIDFYFNYLRWNSSYLAWDRLIYLQCAILQLNVNLSCSFICEEKADGAKLKKVILNDNEWDLLDELCNILAPFEKATRDFSGSSYVTLSKMVPIITNLTSSLEPSNDLHEENYDDSDATIGSDDSEDVEDISTDQINYDNIVEVLDNVKRNIYMGLKHYWKIPN
jgi:hypothetical protein